MALPPDTVILTFYDSALLFFLFVCVWCMWARVRAYVWVISKDCGNSWIIEGNSWLACQTGPSGVGAVSTLLCLYQKLGMKKRWVHGWTLLVQWNLRKRPPMFRNSFSKPHPSRFSVNDLLFSDPFSKPHLTCFTVNDLLFSDPFSKPHLTCFTVNDMRTEDCPTFVSFTFRTFCLIF